MGILGRFSRCLAGLVVATIAGGDMRAKRSGPAAPAAGSRLRQVRA